MSDIDSVAVKEKLKSFIERLEHIEEEKAALLQGSKEIFEEAKGEGFDPAIMRHILKLRKMKKEEVIEQDHLLSLYRQAVGLEFESQAAL